MTVHPSSEVNKGSCVAITCRALDGNPDPYMLRLTLDQRELLAVDGLELIYEINGFETTDVGYYECQAFTLFFDDTEEYTEVRTEIKLKDTSSSNTGGILFVVSLVVFVPVAVLVGILLSRVYWKRKLLDKDNRANDSTIDLKEEEHSHYTSITPHFQSESVYMKLTKKTSLEVSREFLCLRETLGEGAFGRVVKAEAWNIAGREGVTNVAVKMLKEPSLDIDKRDFLKELDLMKSMGSHPNVVSLLGCCSEHEPFYIILEFMEGGNLVDFLRNNRSARGDAYTNAHDVNETLTNTDLMTFAYQVSSGMEFLSSNVFVHRDLAARNVLLDKHNVCKISDFGLARDVVDKHQYERKTQDKLPIRWMAMESLFDGIFTTKSDVWSFGIVMWEIITKGRKPYPGMTGQEVMSAIQECYRMPKPSHCDDQLYLIMLSCWDENPEKRPSFTELTEILKKLIKDEKAYVKITGSENEGYLEIDA